jgi:hypothetical protein
MIETICRLRCARLLAAIVGCILLSDRGASAGQLHVEEVTLDEVAEHGFALFGTIVSRAATSHTVQVKVKKIWRGPSGTEQQHREGITVGFAPGDVRELPIYDGVEWTDPGESPIDRRVPGALSFEELTVGRDVIIVEATGFEALPADSHTLAKLDMFFSRDGIERYKKESTVAQLFVDLKDADLRRPALNAMRERGRLDPPAFLALPGYEFFGLAYQLSEKMERRALNDWLLAMIAAKMDGGWRVHLASFVLDTRIDKIDKETRLAMAESFDPADSEQVGTLSLFLCSEAETLRKRRDQARAVQLAKLAAKLEAGRREEANDRDDETLRTLFVRLPADDRIRLVVDLGKLIGSSPAAKAAEAGVDDRLLSLVAAEIVRAPNRAYLPVLAAIEIRLDAHSLDILRRHRMLDAGLAIAAADRASASAVYATLKRWLPEKKEDDPEIADKAWRATVTKVRALAKR